MTVLYAGLDLHSTGCDVTVMGKEGNIVERQHLETSAYELVAFFSSFQNAKLKLHLEASELTGWARMVLLEHVPQIKEVVASHPKSLSWIANDPLKGDRLDSWKLAELMRMGRTHPVYYPEAEKLAIFKKTVQHYMDITDQQAALKCKIKSRLRTEGIITSEGVNLYSDEGKELALSAIDSTFRRDAIGQLYTLLGHSLQCQEDAFRLMKKQSDSFPVIARYQKMPGVALRLGCRFVGYIQNPYRFATKQKLFRYCALGITERSSNGQPLGYKRLDRNGCGALKDMSRKIFNAAALMRKDNNRFKRFYHSSLQRTGKQENARLNTQRKILETMLIMWKKGTEYDDNYTGEGSP